MSTLLLLLFVAGCAALAMLCVARPRLGMFVTVVTFCGLGVHEAIHGLVTCAFYCVVYTIGFVLMARASVPTTLPMNSRRVGD